MYRLLFDSGLRKGQVYDADDTPIVDLGRDPSCRIALPEPGVSRRHSIIQQMEDGIYISDLSSTNGTYVNSQKISKEHRLKSGDQVEVGSVKFTFQLGPATRPGQRRDWGKMFAVAVTCVAAVLLVEIVAIGVSWMVRNGGKVHLPWSETNLPPVAASPAADESVSNRLGDVQLQLDAKLQRLLEIAHQISENKEANKTDVDALVVQMNSIRADIDGLKRQINDLAAKTVVPAPAAASPSSPPRAPVADPILEHAQQMVADADLAKMEGRFDDAIRILQGASLLAPEYPAAIRALAEMYEWKGLTDSAKEAWKKIVAMGPGAGAAYAEANQHLSDLARKEASSKLPELKPLPKPAILDTASSKSDLPRQLRIIELQRIDHPEDHSLDERYEVKAVIRAQTGEKYVATDAVRVEVRFYDRLDTGEIVETNAETTQDLKMPAVWEGFDRKTFTVEYRAAKGLRKKETDETGRKRTSYGFIVRVYYRDRLEDQRADPEKLLTLAASQAKNIP